MINKEKYLPKRSFAPVKKFKPKRKYIQLDDRDLSKLKKHRRVTSNDFVIDIVKNSTGNFKIFGKIGGKEK